MGRSVLRACASVCAVVWAIGCGSSGEVPEQTGADEVVVKPQAIRVRIMTGNLTSGDRQSYDPGHGARIFRALAPDVALIQELNVGDRSETALRRFVDDAFGPKFFVHREEGFGAANGIPNGIVSRFPIRERGTWTDPGSSGTRGFAWARIDLPNGDDLLAVSVHFKASGGSFEVRNTQASTLARAIRSMVEEGAPVVIGGDLNTESPDEPCFKSLAPVVDVAGPYPADEKGLTGTNTKRDNPYDWVLVDKGLRAQEVPVTLGSTTFANGIVFAKLRKAR
jgi:endonuclease/exonuclease/phosphatase family metal-dependent hydrolase